MMTTKKHKNYYILNWGFDVYEDVHKGIKMTNPFETTYRPHKFFKKIRKSDFAKDNLLSINENFYEGDYYKSWIEKIMKIKQQLGMVA